MQKSSEKLQMLRSKNSSSLKVAGFPRGDGFCSNNHGRLPCSHQMKLRDFFMNAALSGDRLSDETLNLL